MIFALCANVRAFCYMINSETTAEGGHDGGRGQGGFKCAHVLAQTLARYQYFAVVILFVVFLFLFLGTN